MQHEYDASNEDEIIQANVYKQTRQECRLEKNWTSILNSGPLSVTRNMVYFLI